MLTLLVLLASAGLLASSWLSNRTKRELHQVRAELAAAQGHWDVAATELNALLKLDPNSQWGHLLLADVEYRRGRLPDALRHVSRVSSESAFGREARLLEGTLLLRAGQASRAEAALKECLQLDPRAVEARRRLVFLYGIELRRTELTRVLWELRELEATQISDLVLLSGSSFIVWNAAEILPIIERFVATDPADVFARVAAGRYRLRQNDLTGAHDILEEACRLAASDPEPHVALAECLFERNELADAARFLKSLPAEWERDPRLSYFRARLAEEFDRTAEAQKFYEFTIERDPDHKEAQYRLGQLLVASGRSDLADSHLDRAKKLADRELLLSTVVNTGEAAKHAPAIARLEAALGHEDLAEAWYAEAVRLNPDDDALRLEAARLSGTSDDDPAVQSGKLRREEK